MLFFRWCEIKIGNFNFDPVLLAEKLQWNILVHEISYKTLIGVKRLCLSFDEADRFIRICYGTRYIVVFGGEKFFFINSRFIYLIAVESGIT